MIRSRVLRASAGVGVPELVGSVAKTDASGSWSIVLSGMGIRPGDIGILMAANEGTHVSVSTPAFSTLLSGASGGAYGRLFARIMDGTEPSVGGANANSAALIFTVWRRAAIPSEVGVVASDNPPAVDTRKGDTTLIFAVANHWVSMGIAVPGGYTPISNEISRGYTRAWAGYAPEPSVPTENPPALGYSGIWGDLAFTVVVPRN